mgnify:CR=1 FL=1
MTKKEKKEQKLKSIEIMETKKVDQWKKDDVFSDISVFDLSKAWKINPESFFGKSKNSPFDGLLVEGKNVMTFVRGRLVYRL